MPNNFKKTKYKILKQCISKELCEFVYTHLLIKKNVCDVLFEKKQLPYWEIEWGHYRDPQVPNTYSIYGDTVTEQLLIRMKPLVEKTIGKKLIENYSFARVYKKYDVLKKHIDRYSCEFSTTLNLGGDLWPIYLMSDKKEIKVELNPGDMLVYRGCELLHWRDAFLGKVCGQVFLHYNSADDDNKWDGRPCIGYPFPNKEKINKKPKQ